MSFTGIPSLLSRIETAESFGQVEMNKDSGSVTRLMQSTDMTSTFSTSWWIYIAECPGYDGVWRWVRLCKGHWVEGWVGEHPQHPQRCKTASCVPDRIYRRVDKLWGSLTSSSRLDYVILSCNCYERVLVTPPISFVVWEGPSLMHQITYYRVAKLKEHGVESKLWYRLS